MNKLCLATLLVCCVGLVLAGCGGGGETSYAEPAAAEEPAETTPESAHAAEATETTHAATDPHVHPVRCGCSIEEIGTCGNYIEIDGQFVPLVASGDVELGEMAFCGQTDVMAHVDGEMKEGEFVATSFAYVE